MDADGRNVARLTDHGPTITIRRGCPTAKAWCSLRIAIAGRAASICIALCLADGSRRAPDEFFKAMRSCRACRPTATGSRLSQRRFRSRRLCEPGARPRDRDEADVAVRRHGVSDAGRTGRRTASRSPTCRCQRGAVEDPDHVVVRHRPRADAGEPARWHYYPDWSPGQPPARARRSSPEHHDGEDWDLAILDPSRATPLQRLTTGAGNDRLPGLEAQITGSREPGAGNRSREPVIIEDS